METLQSEARPGDHSHPIPQSLVSLINTLNERNSYKSPDAIASEEARSALNNSQCNTELYMSTNEIFRVGAVSRRVTVPDCRLILELLG
ncbi:hypothetical protein QQF64_021530 [Cirrhinus molitorella]|uniref:Uncharacterized protein n=1 Tax=Cirrhinus molitorella TaxID=172907 RepID=A0ABR3L5W7_9TELE